MDNVKTNTGSPSTQKKKRGGQRNNKNAYKHGFYSKYYSSRETKALSDIPQTDATDFIDLMRISTRRFLEAYTASFKEMDYDDKHAAFRSLALAAGVIASLIRIQVSMGHNRREADEISKQIRSLEDSIMSPEQDND